MTAIEQGFLYSFAFSIIFWNCGLYLVRNLNFRLGQGRYCGSFPVLGAFLGASLGLASNFNDVHAPILLGLFFMGILGFIRDYKRVSYAVIVPYALLVAVLVLAFVPSLGLSFAKLLLYVFWIALVVFCLKLASLVYEMPFILLCMTALTTLLYFLQVSPKHPLSLPLTMALLVPSVLLFFVGNLSKEKSKEKSRFLLGSSGVFALGFGLACLTILEKSPIIALLGLCVPSMVIGFPMVFISAVLVFSYFGNKLHKSNVDATARPFCWSLRRQKAILLAGLIFLCINFGLLISTIKTPVIGLFFLLLLLSLAIAGFINAFIRKKGQGTATPSDESKTIKVLGITINSCTQEELLEQLEKSMQNPSFTHIITADSLALVRAREDEFFRGIMERAELVIADGAGIVWASDFLGTPLKARVPGVALVEEICRRSTEKDWGLYFLGGKPGIIEGALAEMQNNHPIKICGTHHGYFTPNSPEEDAVIEEIAKSNPQIIFVALGVPRQEHFIIKLRDRGLKAVAIGVGGSFDVISKQLPRAPILMQSCGIEWLFRLYLEPFRIARMLKIPIFVLQVLRQKWNED
jgi:N-acetylglucosaminyldiphosphoundecaprenol N-acetyl-beta-D-mannosaminyltransferase